MLLFAIYFVQALFYFANLIAIAILLSHIRKQDTNDHSLVIYQSILSLDAVLTLVNFSVMLWKTYLVRKMGKLSGKIITREELEELKEQGQDFQRRNTDFEYRNEEEGNLRYAGMNSEIG